VTDRSVTDRQPRLEPVLVVAVDEMVVVVTGEEDQPPALQLRRNRRQQPISGIDRVVDRAKEEVEEVAEEDQLIDSLQRRRQPLEKELLCQQIAPRPGAEVGVGDDQALIAIAAIACGRGLAT
jgi:hypothetical protein